MRQPSRYGRRSIRDVSEPSANARAHHRRRLTGRNPGEEHRTATPLELLFDLTFVVAFGIAANELAHYLARARSGRRARAIPSA
jgi:hypothetical protein